MADAEAIWRYWHVLFAAQRYKNGLFVGNAGDEFIQQVRQTLFIRGS
jgi:hypothetical protein